MSLATDLIENVYISGNIFGPTVWQNSEEGQPSIYTHVCGLGHLTCAFAVSICQCSEWSH